MFSTTMLNTSSIISSIGCDNTTSAGGGEIYNATLSKIRDLFRGNSEYLGILSPSLAASVSYCRECEMFCANAEMIHLNNASSISVVNFNNNIIECSICHSGVCMRHTSPSSYNVDKFSVLMECSSCLLETQMCPNCAGTWYCNICGSIGASALRRVINVDNNSDDDGAADRNEEEYY